VTDIQAVAASHNHALALTRDGRVWGWGDNSYGKLGSVSSQPLTPALIVGVENVAAVAVGGDYSLVLKQDGTVWAWGANWFGTLGDGTEVHRSSPMAIAELSDIIAISAIGGPNLALKRDGTVWAWGSIYYCSTDVCMTEDIVQLRPVQIAGLERIVAIKAGYDYAVALRNDGTIWSWGRNRNGNLGDGTSTVRNTPVQITGLPALARIFGQIGLTSEGACWVWGADSQSESTLPQRMQSLDNMVELAPNASLALRTDGAVLAKTALGIYSQTPVSGLPPVATLASGPYVFVVTTAGEVWGWGSNTAGQLGVSATTNKSVATPVTGLTSAISISTGQHYSLAAKNDGTLWSWGRLATAGNATGTTVDESAEPLQVLGISTATAVSAGDFHNLILLSDGSVWAWGSNSLGGLGITDMSGGRTTPAQVPGPAGILAIQASQALNLARTADGALWVWGRPISDGPILAPARIAGLGAVVSAANSSDSIIAALSDGSVWEWLPDGSLNQIASLSNVTQVFAGYGRRFALKTDGTLWGWGRNYNLAIHESAGHLVFGLVGSGDSDYEITTPRQVLAPPLLLRYRRAYFTRLFCAPTARSGAGDSTSMDRSATAPMPIECPRHSPPMRAPTARST
jgi:alpha-tubulin suppressor-like RCC1 family protein